MSLVNKALRKAQQDRSSPDLNEPLDNSTSHLILESRGKQPLGLIIGLVLAVAMLIGLVIGLSLVLLRDSTRHTEITRPPTTEPATPAAAPALPRDVALAPDSPSIEESIPLPSETINENGPAIETETDVLSDLRAAREAVEEKLEAEESEPSIVDWLTQSRISAVKISSKGNRVTMNGVTYTEDEYVNQSLGLKVMLIEETRVLFIDKANTKYMKKL